MSLDKETRLVNAENAYFYKLVMFLFATYLGWGYCICYPSPWVQNIASLFFTLGSIFWVSFLFRFSAKIINEKQIIIGLLIVSITLHLGLILGIGYFDKTGQLFWVKDSYDMHIPGSTRMMAWFSAGDRIVRSSLYDRTYTAHILVSLFFSLFGINQVSTALAMLFPKLIGSLFIYLSCKKISNQKNAILAFLIYSFLPTSVFYTLTYYKESTVQMYVAILLFLTLLLFESFSWKILILYLGMLALAGNERHYLVPCYVIGFAFLFFLDPKKPLWFRLLPIPITGLCYYCYMYIYEDMILATVWASLIFYRDAYHSYADVNPINKELPYALAFVKLYLTPIFTISKLKLFTGFSTLLTWGSFSYQLVALLSLWGLKVQKIRRLNALIWVPILIFISVFAYVAPYNGRLRDSFLPIIVVFSVIGLNDIINKFFRENKKQIFSK